ncbi:BnaCnng11460D [Brassica napus]|uniref:BnaCnng11460D protein n=1 Tax=Brassica napus TaxID=3708 RepID=A0A078I135_BRANA|nr:BnaCnng11460D [Brassica napus]
MKRDGLWFQLYGEGIRTRVRPP